MSEDDVLVKNVLIQAVRTRPFFWDKSREDFNDFKTMAASKQEWLDIFDEGREYVKLHVVSDSTNVRDL